MSSDTDLLNDILDAAEEAVSYVDGMTFDDFRADQKTQAAVMYRLGIIGEAARHVTQETQSRYHIDWVAIRGMRNRLVHGYGSVRPLTVWKTVAEDLPTLLQELRK